MKVKEKSKHKHTHRHMHTECNSTYTTWWEEVSLQRQKQMNGCWKHEQRIEMARGFLFGDDRTHCIGICTIMNTLKNC